MDKTNPPRSNEPAVWLLFGAGGAISAVFFPVLVLILGLLLPFGLVSADNIIAFSQTFIGKLAILALLIFPMWCGMHRIHLGLHDFKVHVPAGGWIFYGLSALYSVLVFFAVFSL
ncbi:reductase [Bibersteinia trehalosi USDA-ARS-USMARC-188]|uniref:Fumarate reductase subunit D n=5 Tax=Bibersteinia trehalosi TaxID=47735 RepID=W0R580_BIBTR|nr:fumarate reductase subunit FrdD [Bibersteinia trehalosi]AGH37625.1 reductase [Bibersteinia trehalosi USDA-ARS-USMARC-192]AHG82566.1 reductase [Bibersteinia trehalosi USDA-ARS-USMARC-188]AHG84900.1 reductase [Bibersteinia trehalosi USDA-ARS-USMARC-189]AHG85617.1 reductase [Bibersteinia trehalosi USDA-ARS-USMARC-190]OAQ13724.1 fumarate reductase [Bibersteinia trehalosi Y31]